MFAAMSGLARLAAASIRHSQDPMVLHQFVDRCVRTYFTGPPTTNYCQPLGLLSSPERAMENERAERDTNVGRENPGR